MNMLSEQYGITVNCTQGFAIDSQVRQGAKSLEQEKRELREKRLQDEIRKMSDAALQRLEAKEREQEKANENSSLKREVN